MITEASHRSLTPLFQSGTSLLPGVCSADLFRSDLFRSALHVTFHPTGRVSEEGRHACLTLLKFSDCVYFVFFSLIFVPLTWLSRLHSYIISSFVCVKFFIVNISCWCCRSRVGTGRFYFENRPAAPWH